MALHRPQGLRPESFSANGAAEVVAAPAMLELEAAGVVRVSEAGLEIDRAPDGIRFEPLAEHPRLGELVGADEKFAAHNAAEWQHGLLVQVPKGVVLEQAAARADHELGRGRVAFWRLLIAAEQGSRVSVIEEYASMTPELSGASTPPSRSSSRTAPRSSTSRAERQPRDVALHGACRGIERDAELDWVAGGFAGAKWKIRSRTTSPAQARPWPPARTSPTASSTSTTTPSRSTYGAEHDLDFAFKGVLSDQSSASGAG